MLKNTYKNPDFSRQTVENRRKRTDLHFHDDHELYYLINGTTKYLIDDKIFQVNSGNIVIIPAGMNHKTDSENCLVNERILISFKSDTFSVKASEALDLLFSENVIYIPNSKLDILETIFSKIENEYKLKDEYSKTIINSYIEELIIQIVRFGRKQEPGLNENDKIIHKISEYIASNYTQDLSLPTLSRNFSISTSHLSRQFKIVTGINISEYITYVRILNAEKLLKKTTLPITEVAGLCGFNDSNYFSTVFKNIKGITPLKYSRRFQENNVNM